MKKIYKIFLIAVPVLVMMGMIPLIKNDYLLSVAFVVISGISLLIKRRPKELPVFIIGFFLMTFFEYIFVMTGVEVFYRNTLFGVMPIWLPLLWAYGFVAMDRAVKVLDR